MYNPSMEMILPPVNRLITDVISARSIRPATKVRVCQNISYNFNLRFYLSILDHVYIVILQVLHRMTVAAPPRGRQICVIRFCETGTQTGGPTAMDEGALPIWTQSPPRLSHNYFWETCTRMYMRVVSGQCKTHSNRPRIHVHMHQIIPRR